GGYSLRPGFRLPPLMFNPDEIVTVMVGLGLMRELGTFSPHWIESATAKIERVLPQALQQKAQALRQFLAVEALPLRNSPLASEWLLTISLAALESRCLWLTYETAEEQTQRVISPYGLVLHGKTWYIPAYCHWRVDRRIFRLDRIRELRTSDEPYKAADQPDPKTYVLESLARLPGIYEFEVLIHAPLDTVAAYIPADMALLESEAGKTRMRCYEDDPYWLARFLAQLEFPFTVQKTETLKTALQTIAQRLLESI
ncbi:MAG TPA: WYL domain-containing protein, partial [Phototrophicaceae bacterium]|nr:WYL domain-containing protein [Phototrophicaceae bacterium]